LPTIEIVSLVRHRPNPDTLMTARLEQALRDTVAAGEQAIVFLNRRGFATALTCASCGSMQQCPDCSAPSMTYHLQRNRLVCHLCGHVEAVPAACRACGGGPLEHGSAGTERVEVALEARFPGIRTLRLDRDASRGRKLLEVLGRFRAREADVLVGTQMLAKGHDFPGVTLVGVLQADHGLGLPDPRAAERVFQLLTQVAGRAGRGDRAGRVIVQAWAAEHPAIVAAAAHDWEGFVADELERRRELGNPPFGHLAVLRVSSLDEAQVRLRTTALADRAVALARRIREEGGTLDVRGPAPALFERVNGRTRWQLLLRTPSRPTLRRVLTALRPHLQGDRDVLTVVDVDPQTLV
jgi:primosomal protein N' (replication factor Y)